MAVYACLLPGVLCGLLPLLWRLVLGVQPHSHKPHLLYKACALRSRATAFKQPRRSTFSVVELLCTSIKDMMNNKRQDGTSFKQAYAVWAALPFFSPGRVLLGALVLAALHTTFARACNVRAGTDSFLRLSCGALAISSCLWAE